MTKTMLTTRTALVAAALAGAIWSLPQASLAAPRNVGAAAQAQLSSTATAQSDTSASANAASRLDKKQYANVKATVDNGIATLTGSVDLYEYKADAEKRVRKAKGVTAVRNLIEVAGPTIPDQELQAKLAEKLAYDHVGYGNAFNAISISVHNGVVTLGGHALNYLNQGLRPGTGQQPIPASKTWKTRSRSIPPPSLTTGYA